MEVFDTRVLQTACLIFKYVFMQQNVFVSLGELNTGVNDIADKSTITI